MSSSGSRRAVIAALSANLAIAVLKAGAWVLTGASSLLAEAVHSAADTANQGLLLRGAKAGAQPADAAHPFGYGRERYLSAFLVSITIFSAGGLFAIYEAFHKFTAIRAGEHDALLEGPWWWVPLVVLVGAIVAEGLSLRTAVRESRPLKGSQTWWQFVRTTRSPELPTVLLEDLAAELGLLFALAGVGLTLLTGNDYFDVAGTVLIGLLLIAVGWILGTEMKSLLVGESAVAAELELIAAALLGPGVERVIHLKAVHLGPEDVFLGAKIAVPAAADAVAVALAIDEAEARVRAAVPTVRTIYLEPDLLRSRPLPPGESETPA